MAELYNNIPKETTSASNSDFTVQVFDQYFQTPTALNNSELTMMTGFFESRGFDKVAAESTALVILQQAKRDGFNAMQVMDTLKEVSPIEISTLVAEILNFNRFKTSSLVLKARYASGNSNPAQSTRTEPVRYFK